MWHKFQHKMGWWSGHVVTRTDDNGRLFIGFMCNQCCKVFGEHDASNVIDRHIDAHLIYNASRTRTL